MKYIIAALFTASLLFLAPVSAVQAGYVEPSLQTTPQDMELIGVGTVAEILGPDKFKTDKGAVYKLDNIRVPISFDEAAIAALKKILLNQRVGLYARKRVDGNYKDKYGEIYAHVMTLQKRWIQADMVASGLAFASSTAEHRDLVNTLYKYEKAARAANVGIWSVADFRPKTERDTKNLIGSFQLYEGQVVERRKVKQTSYLIFTKLKTEKDAVKAVMENDVYDSLGVSTGIKNFDATNRFIRVRGWVESSESGPIIQITHPEQVEVIEALRQ